jgi:hypothetical protein
MTIKKEITLVVNSKKAQKGLDDLSGGLKGVGKESKGVSKGFKGIGIAMKAMGWGVLVGLLAAVFEAFKRNQKVQDLVARGFDTLQKVVNVVIDVFEFALKAVDKLTFGLFNLAGASDTASASLQQQRNEVRLLQAQEQLITLQYQKSAEIQRQIRDDESKSMTERKAANEELGRLLTEQHGVEMENANKALAVAEREAEADKNNVDLQEKVIMAKTRVAEVDERITGQRSEMLVNINSLNRETDSSARSSGKLADKNTDLAKSYAELNAAIRESLGLDETVKGITDEIAEAKKNYQIVLDKLEEEEEDILKKKTKRRKKSFKSREEEIHEEIKQLNKSNEVFKVYVDKHIELEKGRLANAKETEKGYKLVFDEEKKAINKHGQEVKGAWVRIYDEQSKETVKNWEQEIKTKNEQTDKKIQELKKELDGLDGLTRKAQAKEDARVEEHNNKVLEELDEHAEKREEREAELTRAINEAYQKASEELDYFLGTEREKEEADLQVEFENRMAMVEGNILDEIRLEIWKEEQMLEINTRYREEEEEKQREAQEKLLEQERLFNEFMQMEDLSEKDQKLAALTLEYEELQELYKDNKEKMLEIDETYAAKKKEIEDLDARNQRQKFVDELGKTFGMAASIYEKGSKGWKNLKIAEALVSTYSAINKAMDDIPFPLNIVQAALTGIMGFQNVQAIKNTEMSTSTTPSGGLQQLSAGVSVGGDNPIPTLPEDMGEIEQPPIQAFVVESNVSGKQALQNDLELQATL